MYGIFHILYIFIYIMLKYTFNCLIIKKNHFLLFWTPPKSLKSPKNHQKHPKNTPGYQVVKYIFKRNINRDMWNMTFYV